MVPDAASAVPNERPSQLRVYLPRASVVVRGEKMLIPRPEAYTCSLFTVLQPVEYRTAPTLENVTSSGYSTRDLRSVQ